MTMNTGLARALRRFGAVSVMMLAGQAGVHDLLFADPELPSRCVDRVVVTVDDGRPREITDPAAVRRIVRLVRSRGDDQIRTRQLCLAPGMNVTFFRGTEPRGGIALSGGTFRVPARYDDVVIVLDPSDAAELHRLLRIP